MKDKPVLCLTCDWEGDISELDAVQPASAEAEDDLANVCPKCMSHRTTKTQP